MPNNILTVERVQHTFPEDKKKFEAIRDVSFSVKPGSFTAIVGPSGGGKSTLLRIIAGLIKPTGGDIKIETNKIALVFQNFALFPWLTAFENIEFGLKMSARGGSASGGKFLTKNDRHKIVHQKIAEVGLTGFEHKYPKELSGGMRQRVGLARALAVSPDLLLMDEPFSSLDTFTAEKLRKDLLDIWLKYKMTIVMVTHLIEEAVALGDEVIVLSARPAQVKSTTPIPLPRPRNLRSPEFFRLVDELTAQIEQ